MSLAARVTTEAEDAFLRANGWMRSSLECFGGNWVHPEFPGSHYGPEEALRILKERLASLPTDT